MKYQNFICPYELALKMQELRHKFRNQILEYWGEDTGILIGITMVHERHLWNEEVKVI